VYLVVVKFRSTCGRCPAGGTLQRLPPMKFTPIASGSSLAKERSAWVAWPLTSLMPKISEEGNCTETFTLIVGEFDRLSTSSSACGQC